MISLSQACWSPTRNLTMNLIVPTIFRKPPLCTTNLGAHHTDLQTLHLPPINLRSISQRDSPMKILSQIRDYIFGLEGAEIAALVEFKEDRG